METKKITRTITKTRNGLRIVTSKGRVFYRYPEEVDYKYYLKEYLENNK